MGWKLELCLLGIALSGCGSDRVAGGGGTETTNGLNIEVLASDGRPVPGARVQLVRTDTWVGDVANFGSPLVLSLEADGKGEVHLDSLPIGDWSAQVDWGSQSGIVRLNRADSAVSLPLRVRTNIDLVPRGDSTGVLRVAGSNWAWTPQQGAFRFGLPPGEYALAASRGSILSMAGHVTVSVGIAIDSTVSVDQRRVQIDDFASDDGWTTLWRYTSFGNWYTVGSSGTRIYSPTDTSGATYDGQLSMSYSIGDSSGWAIAGISFVNGQGYHDLDLTTMDSLCFDVAGSGLLQPYLSHIYPDQSHNSVMAAPISLSSIWTRACVTPGSFGGSWDSIRTVANDLAFMGTKGSQVQVRNIVLWGVPLQALAP